MGLTDLWKSSRSQLEDKQIQQIIAFAGSGKLKDGSNASDELREFLLQVPTLFLNRYAEECLTEKFEGNGFALQDIVNQAGRRLGFSITDGRYRGIVGHEIGFDGLWHSADGHGIVVEVKTSDAYRIDLNIIANYRRSLIKEGRITEDHSSILIIVGREDTGDLEAQIRGSKHAWDIRLISVDALLRLVSLKENVDDPQIICKICDILIPREFTKVDGIIDIVFSTAEDVLQVETPEDQNADDSLKPKIEVAAFNDECIKHVEAALGQSLIKRARVTYTSPDDSIAVICSVSRRYDHKGTPGYWFAFHPHQGDFLARYSQAYLALGCGSAENVVLIPYNDFSSWLDKMWTTTRANGKHYWHIVITDANGKMLLGRKSGSKPIDLSKYLLKRK